MKIKILKSNEKMIKKKKEMIRNKNKPAKPPKTSNPQNPGRPTCQKKQKRRKGELPKDWHTNPAKHETAPKFYLFASNRIKI